MKIVRKPEDSAIPPTSGKKRRLRLRKPADAIRLLNQIVNGLMNGEMETDRARCLIYACSTLPKLFEAGDLDERVTALEERGK